MKRATLKKTPAIAPKKAEKPVLVCQREGCGKVLSGNRKKFCSHQHRNEFLSGGENGGGEEIYKKEYATTRMQEYLDDCEKKNEPTLIPTANSFIIIHNARIPQAEEYADLLGVHPNTLANWAKRHNEFARALDRLMRVQKTWLINNGLAGRYTPQISKLILGSNHGIIEKKEVDTKHKFLGIVRHIYEGADELDQGHE